LENLFWIPNSSTYTRKCPWATAQKEIRTTILYRTNITQYFRRTQDRDAYIDTSCDSGTATLETYYSNFIARQLYAQKCLKYMNIQYKLPGRTIQKLIAIRKRIHLPSIFDRELFFSFNDLKTDNPTRTASRTRPAYGRDFRWWRNGPVRHKVKGNENLGLCSPRQSVDGLDDTHAVRKTIELPPV